MGKAFYGTTAMILLGLVGLAAPAATAGAICLDKARGNLTLLFATDLSDAEIVLGKLAARLVPVLGLILCAAPVLAIATLFGGIDPVGLVGALLVVLACAVFGCTLALTLSVWGRKTHEVLMATYVFGILYLLAAPILAGLQAMTARRRGGRRGCPSFLDLLPYNPIFLVLATLEGPPPGMRAGDDRGRRRRSSGWAWRPRRCWSGRRPGGSGRWSSGSSARASGRRDGGGRRGRSGAIDLERLGRRGPAAGPARRSVAGSWPGRRWTATRCSGASASGGGRRAGASRSGGSTSCSAAGSASTRSPR